MLAEEQLNNQNARRYVPSNIQPGMFVTFVYDNCDHNADSIYNVTLNGTNGIVIQASKHEFNGIVSHTSEPSTSSRRSFKTFSQELQPYIKSKYRPNPLSIQNLENHVNQLDGLISNHEDIVWSILRHKSGGFFYRSSQYEKGFSLKLRKQPQKNIPLDTCRP